MLAVDRLLQTLETTEKRFEERTIQRSKINDLNPLKRGAYVSPTQALERLSYKGYKGNDILFADRLTLERTIGTDDLLKINYFVKGLKAAKAVGRITINTAFGSGYGTGFLISENLLMTNNHVLKSKIDARNSYVEFNYEEDADDKPSSSIGFSFDPDRFFITSINLDFTIVYVNPTSFDGNSKLTDFGIIKLIEETGKLQIGERVSIIQHPNGERKQVALRNNEVIDIFDQFIHYKTDTEPGSSGSPVFNEDWEVVGLHHSGVPERNSNGDLMTRDGKVWRREDGAAAISWIANEGIRISSIIKHLRLYADREEKILLRHILGNDPAYNDPKTKDPNPSTDTNYYNATEDGDIIKNYYSSINTEKEPVTLYHDLSGLLRATHSVILSYSPSRYLYPEVDVHEDGFLRSVYSGKKFSVEEFILMDEMVDLERKAKILELKKNNEVVLLEDFAKMLDDIERSHPYNCEHVVPQSWFNKRNPMRADLHHLFACETRCNSFRGNLTFFDFKDYDPPQTDEKVRNDCGKREGQNFEPEFNKGAVARATLYYLVRYPRSQENNYSSKDIDTLLKWHRENEVSVYEKHRNYKIYQMQGNRNPFIDFPELADKVDFSKGL